MSRLTMDRFSEVQALHARLVEGHCGADRTLLAACRVLRGRLLATYKRRGIDPEKVLAEYKRPRAAKPMPILSTAKPVVDAP